MMRNQVLKHIFIWLGAIAGLGAIFFLMYFLVWNSSGDAGRVYDIRLNASDWKRGNPDAKLVLVEYSDFQCPACAVYFPVVERLLKDYPDKVLFVYRHFPLTQIHKNANLAAYAAEASGKQEKFWRCMKKYSRAKNFGQTPIMLSKSFSVMPKICFWMKPRSCKT